jgi:lipooligosaccharide transport system permease protein
MFLFGMGLGIGGYLTSLEGTSYIQFIAPGIIMVTAMYSASFECTFGSYTRMMGQKTYDGILATPLSVGDIVMGDILWGATKSLISGGIMLTILILAGLMKGPMIFIIPILILIFLVGLMFASMAMLATALSPSYEFFSYYFTLTLTPMFFFSGVFFPLEKFPLIIKGISYLLPLTYAVNISRSLITENFSYIALSGFPLLLALTIILIIAAVNLIEKKIVK